jgi:hypothetical protein
VCIFRHDGNSLAFNTFFFFLPVNLIIWLVLIFEVNLISTNSDVCIM